MGLFCFQEESNKMSQEKESKTKGTKKGQFQKGNTVGKETRFKKDNQVACKYKEEYCDMLIEFFNKPATKIVYKEMYHKGELTCKIPIVLPEEYPTFELFAASIGVTTRTLKNWCDESPRFSFYYARAKEIQLGKLTSMAVTGMYNPVYAKFEAVNNHNQKDKQEIDTNVKGEAIDDKTRALIERVEKRLKGAEKDK